MRRPRYMAWALFALMLPPFLVLSQEPQPAPKAQPDQAAPPPSDAKAAPSPASTIPPDSTALAPIKTKKAIYPLQAEKQGIQGQVMLKLLVSETGDVEHVDVISGDPILVDSAVDAAKKWKFKPFIKNGKPVKVSTQLPMDFAFGDQVKDIPIKDSPAPAPGVAPGPRLIASGMATGLLIRRVNPIYPIEARRDGIQGVVVLRAVIDKDGRISQLSVVSGPKELAAPATGAVQQWRYRPYMLNGEPVQVQTEIRVNFQLQR